MITAKKLNDHLEAGGVVQVTTYTKSTLYKQRHTGWFTESAKGELFVQRGRGKDCLATKDRLLVGIKLYRINNSHRKN